MPTPNITHDDAHLFTLIQKNQLTLAKEFLNSKFISKETKEANVWYRDTQSVSPLHIASKTNDLELVKMLVYNGHAWNVVDANMKSAGEYAMEHKQRFNSI